MSKTILKSVLMAASLSAFMVPAYAADLDAAALTDAINANPEMADSILAAAIESVCYSNTELSKSCANPSQAEDAVSTAILALGADSPEIANILSAAVDAGISSDSITAIAIANGVDATVASEATAAGGNIINAVPASSYVAPASSGSGSGNGGGGTSDNQ